MPTLAAARAALYLNTRLGDEARGRLLDRVVQFRQGLLERGIAVASGHLWPIQTLAPPPSLVRGIAHTLRGRGIWPVVQFGPPDAPRQTVLRFILTALHTEEDVGRTVDAIGRALRHCRPGS